MLSCLQSNRGFSLVSVMISTGILGMVILGVASVLEMSFKGEQRIRFTADVANDIFILKNSFARSEICSANLSGLVPSAQGYPLNQNQRSFRYIDEDSGQLGAHEILGMTGELENLKLFRIPDTTDAIRLSLEYKIPGRTMGNSVIHRDVMLATQLDENTGEILNCSSDPFSFARTLASHAGQGRGCSGFPELAPAPYSPTLQNYGRVIKPDYVLSAAQKDAITQLCRRQNYPLRSSVQIPSECNGLSELTIRGSGLCGSLGQLANAEGGFQAYAYRRSGYRNVQECEAQFPLSEGAFYKLATSHNPGPSRSSGGVADTGTYHFVCINSQWVQTGFNTDSAYMQPTGP